MNSIFFLIYFCFIPLGQGLERFFCCPRQQVAMETAASQGRVMPSHFIMRFASQRNLSKDGRRGVLLSPFSSSTLSSVQK